MRLDIRGRISDHRSDFVQNIRCSPGSMTIRLDDRNNPEFWLEINFDADAIFYLASITDDFSRPDDGDEAVTMTQVFPIPRPDCPDRN
jgi:hypothetical protein